MAGTLRHWLLEKTFFARTEPAEFLEPTSQGRKTLLWRRGTLIAAAAGSFIGAHLILGHVKSLPDCESIPWLRGLLVALVLLPAGMAVYGVILARAMLRSGQWPLPGTLVLRRRPLERGVRVRWRAYGLLFACALSAAVVVLAGFLLATSPIFKPPVPGSKCARIEADPASNSLEKVP